MDKTDDHEPYCPFTHEYKVLLLFHCLIFIGKNMVCSYLNFQITSFVLILLVTLLTHIFFFTFPWDIIFNLEII